MFRSPWRRLVNRPASGTRRGRSRLLLEALEDRRLLAGNVTITAVTPVPATEGLLASQHGASCVRVTLTFSPASRRYGVNSQPALTAKAGA